VLQSYIARKRELVGACVKADNGNKIAENVVQPADLPRFGNDRQGLVEYFLVIAVTWPEHHAMVAKTNRHAIAINRDMSNCQDRHSIKRRKNLALLPYTANAESGKHSGAIILDREEASRSVLVRANGISEPSRSQSSQGCAR
jgi:hypothetical protein